ncbi:nucleotidyltransferase [bacterium]|nr:nucleotidyltransferase [bacterium]
MSAKDDILLKLKKAKFDLSKKYPIASMALFGSYSRDDYTQESDVDILVEINGRIGSKFIDLAYDLEEAIGKKVDLVSKNGIKPRYFDFIKSDLIYV